MTSVGFRSAFLLLLGLVPAAAAGVQPTPVQSAPAMKPIAPPTLAARIRQLGNEFDGRVGIAVQSVDEGWRTGWKAEELYPQQSVSKFWVALTAMDAVDKGRVSLADKVSLGRGDLTLFHQPLAAKVLGNGGHTTTLGELLFEAITKSENTANDKLMRSVGGPDAVRGFIARHNITGVRFFDGERALQLLRQNDAVAIFAKLPGLQHGSRGNGRQSFQLSARRPLLYHQPHLQTFRRVELHGFIGIVYHHQAHL